MKKKSYLHFQILAYFLRKMQMVTLSVLYPEPSLYKTHPLQKQVLKMLFLLSRVVNFFVSNNFDHESEPNDHSRKVLAFCFATMTLRVVNST